MSIFIIISMLLLLLACAVVLLPLLRSPPRRQHALLQKALRQGLLTPEEFALKFRASQQAAQTDNTAKTAKALALIMVLGMPLAAYLLYLQIGTPTALELPDHGVRTPSPGANISALAAQAEANPGNLEAWRQLAFAYTQANRFQDAGAALQRALTLTPADTPERAGLLASLAENQLFASTGGIPPEAISNIQEALAIDAQNPRSLWLAGAIAFQQQDYRGAVRYWQSLLPLVDEPNIKASIQEQLNQALTALHQLAGTDINAADFSAGEVADTGVRQPAAVTAGAPGQAKINVAVSFSGDLQQALQQRSDAAPVLFVFARGTDAAGPPLAIQRIDNPQAPLQLVLDNSQAMLPGADLASAGIGGEVAIIARLSWTGNAIAQPGDWQASTLVTLADAPVDIALEVDQLVE